MMKVKRKTLFAREDLANRLSVIAKQHGYSLYNLVNEILELAIRAEDEGINLRKIFEESRILKSAKREGFILGLENLWYDISELAHEKARDEAIKRWYEAGVWLAKRYATAGTEKPFEAFKRSLEAYTWNVPELKIIEEENNVSIRMISPRFTESYTILYSAFLEGALKTLGYEISEREVSTGTIRLKAVRKEADVKE
ncbi:hypothetical protein CW705_02425 [Candidatus Bathyarchaeota archaeon]|nr:MAG: hypothetical protein CW705_02425 [Candidatus Bathyarchaeota archaeon]